MHILCRIPHCKLISHVFIGQYHSDDEEYESRLHPEAIARKRAQGLNDYEEQMELYWDEMELWEDPTKPPGILELVVQVVDALPAATLTSIEFSDTDMEELPDLSRLVNLTSLNVNNCPQANDMIIIADFASLPKLSTLKLDKCAADSRTRPLHGHQTLHCSHHLARRLPLCLYVYVCAAWPT